MRRIIILLFLVTSHVATYACEVCDRNQARLLRGIVHGAGPDSNWDYVSIGITVIITVFTLIFSIKWLIKPNENNIDHIKYSILN